MARQRPARGAPPAVAPAAPAAPPAPAAPAGRRRAPAAPPAAAPAAAVAAPPPFVPRVVVQFLDLKERNDDEYDRLLEEESILSAQKKFQGGLEPDAQARLDNILLRLTKVRAVPHPVVDLLYGGDKYRPNLRISPFKDDPNGVRDILSGLQHDHPNSRVRDHLDGVFTDLQGAGKPDLTTNERALAATYGLLELDNYIDPENSRFYAAVTGAVGEYQQHQLLFDNVLLVLIAKGQAVQQGRLLTSQIRADQWAAVARALIAQGVEANDPLLGLRAEQELGRAAGTTDQEPTASLNIQLPDLEAQAAVEIVKDNLKAMQAVYFTAMLDELKLFQVVDKLIELFNSGMLPLGRGTAGTLLYRYWKKSVNRYSELERRNLYARTLGLPGGDASVDAVNREFDDLWLRFVSSVSAYVRQHTVDDLLRSRNPVAVSQEQVRKSGRDLAANLSLHGYGIAFFAALDFQGQLNDAIALLSDQEVRNAYGARDMWQVIDQVATLELGGAKNSVRCRTMANSGAVIIRWLAENAVDLSGTGRKGILNLSGIRNAPSMPSGRKALDNPSDRDLVDACEQWLAVTGTQDQSVEEYSQASVGPNQTSLPIKIPTVARDLLDAVGVRANGMMAR